MRMRLLPIVVAVMTWLCIAFAAVAMWKAGWL